MDIYPLGVNVAIGEKETRSLLEDSANWRFGFHHINGLAGFLGEADARDPREVHSAIDTGFTVLSGSKSNTATGYPTPFGVGTAQKV